MPEPKIIAFEDFFAESTKELNEQKSKILETSPKQNATVDVPDDILDTVKYLVTHADTHFNFTGEIITLALLSDYFDGDEVELIELVTSYINPELQTRGLPPIPVGIKPLPAKIKKKSEYDDFDPLFILACRHLLDLNSTKSFAGKMKELTNLYGVTSKTWDAWMQIPHYFDYVNTMVDVKFDRGVEQTAKLSIAEKVKEGDLASIKFYYELTGKYRPGADNPNTMAMGMLLQVMMEILTRHVSKDIIEAVAIDLDNSPVGALISGQQPAA
jgi:hypothetical protein